MNIFWQVRASLREMGLIKEVFTFVDANMNPAKMTLKRKVCHNATIKKNNMKNKNRQKNRWLSTIRALAFNLKRLMVLGVERITLLPT